MIIEQLLKDKQISGILTVTGDTPVAGAVETMNQHHVGALLVVDGEKRLLGIVSERDVMRHFAACTEGLQVEEIMTPKERLIIGHSDDTLEYAMRTITENRIRHLPILERERLVGILSIGDVLKAHLRTVERERKMLEDYVNGASLVIE